ncbi:ABC transporter ATP-binding protein [Cloacibacillus sp. An23]|uniref:ABC transporter ATP-binding protein n=1 Tax=Cloacibacillus sp. An23 TaxID=1965591 RepID=UPI000B369EAE|nr:ABC transporter ATP-binding protein [Cloacibacillus sp. An23]OUO93825.1 ABC transporter ATP-binding protein [Cloacibacillus sp. An23]
MSNFLNVDSINVYYGGIHALQDVSIHIDEGEIVSVVGANGAGKSTLLRSIAGDKEIKSGVITFCGEKLPSTSYETVTRGISLVPEGRRIFPNLTVKENLMVSMFNRKDGKEAIEKDFEEVLSLFPRLRERLKQKGGTLSGGEQQMLAIGRALMARPKLLCMDEPSLGLAPIIIDELFDKIVQLNKERGQTILIVEQNAFLALEVAHRAYVIKTGQVTREGVGEELLNDPTIQQEYLGMQQSDGETEED